MARKKTARLLISLAIMFLAAPAMANNPFQNGGNSAQGGWMEMAKEYGWYKSKLSSNPKGSKDGVRNGLGSWREKMAVQVPETRVKPETKAKPETRVKPETKVKPKAHVKPTAPAKKSSLLARLKKTSTSPKPAKKTSAHSHKSTSPAIKDLANIKPPHGVRAIRRVPTRIRTRSR